MTQIYLLTNSHVRLWFSGGAGSWLISARLGSAPNTATFSRVGLVADCGWLCVRLSFINQKPKSEVPGYIRGVQRVSGSSRASEDRLTTDPPVTLTTPTWAKPPRGSPRFKGSELTLPLQKDIDTEQAGNWIGLVIESITMPGQYLFLSDLRDKAEKPRREWLSSIFPPLLAFSGVDSDPQQRLGVGR